MRSGIALTLVALWTCNGQADSVTNDLSNPLRRIEREQLQAAHEARARFASMRVRPPDHGLYKDLRAVIVSDDGSGPAKDTRAQLLTAARKADVQVVLFAAKAEGKSFTGLDDGVLFIGGVQGSEGALSFPESGTDRKASPNLVFSANAGETNPGAIGMAICYTPPAWSQQLELVADGKPRDLLKKNAEQFPDEFVGSGNYPRAPLENWDKLTASNHFTGIGVNRAVEKGSKAGSFEVSFRNLTTHILAQELTEPSIREALTNGHAYVAHDWLCDPTGFIFGAENNLGVFGMGDDAPMAGRTRVRAASPLPAVLRLYHKAEVVREVTGTNLTFEASEPGAYRLEAWLEVNGEPRPWIYSNPVYLRAPGVGDLRLPSMALAPDVNLHKDLVYTEGKEEDAGKHKLDIYAPTGRVSCPVFFFVHGGSWRSGDRSYYVPLGNRYVHEGMIAAVPSYRLAPKNLHPAQIEDVAAAFAWTVRHIAEYGGDTNRIYVGGHSAGAHLAALLALDKRYLASHQLTVEPIRGVVALSGVYNLVGVDGFDKVFGNDPEVRRAASPQFQVRPDAPPFLVSYCQWDYFSVPAQARDFSDALRKAGVKVELTYIPGENHISEMVNCTRPEDPTVAAVRKFIR